MKLTRIEKLILAVVLACVILLAISLNCLAKSLTKIKQSGGLKSAVSEIWNGNSTH